MANHKVLIILFMLILTLTGKDVFSATPLESLIPKRDIPDGWALIEGPRIYTKKSLFEHINGQAELFFKYGFQKSVFAIYRSVKNHENQIELDIYDMGNVLQAFGIFSRFRGEERGMGIGLDSYLDDQSAIFYKGKYFVMIYSTESNPSIIEQFSTNVSKKIMDRRPPPKEIGYFPRNGLQPGSIQYFPEGLLGYQFLKKGFLATYSYQVDMKAEAEAQVQVQDKEKAKAEDKEFHIFIAIFKNSQEAMRTLGVYKDYLARKGKVHLDSPIRFGPHSFRGEDPYQGQVIVTQKGAYLLGVIGFENAEHGEDRLIEFMGEIEREKGPA